MENENVVQEEQKEVMSKPLKARIFTIMQYEKHPITDEELFCRDRIIEGLSRKTIIRANYILHDKDRYTEEEVEKMNGAYEKAGYEKRVAVGDLKNKHWHIVLQCSQLIEITKIAKWFSVPVNFVKIPKGSGAGKYLDCVEYLTHESEKEQLKGKYRYEDSEMGFVGSGSKWREELDKRAERRMKYGRDLDPKMSTFCDVLFDGKTLLQCREEDGLFYADNMEKLKKYRTEYLSQQEAPLARMNFYICGKGGVGKGLISIALARSLYPHLERDEEIFFEVGAKGVTFDGYDGQPVIIWNDMRAEDLLIGLNGRGNVFRVFDTFPRKQRQNVKYGYVSLCNVVNIVNSVQGYREFLDGLAGEYKRNGEEHKAEDKGQSYRRFPIILPLREEDFDVLLNSGYINNTDTYEEFIRYATIRGSMQQIAARCGRNKKLEKKIQQKTMKVVTDEHNKIMDKLNRDVVDEESVEKEFEEFGSIIDVVEDGFVEIDENIDLPFDIE